MDFWYRYRGKLSRFLGVDLTHSQRRYARLLDAVVRPGCRWLDLGCGRQLLPEWVLDRQSQAALAGRASLLIGVDVDASIREHTLIRNRIMAVGEHLPFRDSCLDLVTANVVVEHIADPRALLGELWRVLAPGGLFAFHTPNALNYLVILARLIPYHIRRKLVFLIEGRKEEDVFPTFYRMNSLSSIEKLGRECGWDVVLAKTVGSSGTFGRLGVLGWLELIAMKSIARGRFQSNILCVMQKPPAPEAHRPPAEDLAAELQRVLEQRLR